MRTHNPAQLGLFEPPREPTVPAPIFARGPCVIHVRCPGPRGGQPKPEMVGKLTPHPEHGLIFYHAQSGTQYHRAYDCPCPVDVCLLKFLKTQEIDWIYSYDRAGETLVKAKRIQVEAAGLEVYGNRRRRYLAAPNWTILEGVTERAEKSYRALHGPDGEELFRLPFLKGAPWVLMEEVF